MQAPLRILIDGACPLCKREGAFLMRLDAGRGRLALEDISTPDFDASTYGTTFEAVMGSIHALGPDGTMHTGMEVFRRAYGAVGWGWLLGWTGWPLFKPVMDAAYRWFARNRMRFTFRKAEACEGGRCRV